MSIMAQKLLEALGRLFYKREYIRDLDYKINTAGLYRSAEEFAGVLVLVTFLGGLAATLFVLSNGPLLGFLQTAVNTVFRGFPPVALALLIFVGMLIISYFGVLVLVTSVLTIQGDTRRNNLETALPDFLLLVSANIKAGMPLDQAMYHAAKPEYGLMSIEVRDIIKRSFSGESLETSLDMLADRFDSRIFKRTILLIKQASATGGEVAAVLERTSQEVRNNLLIRKEVAASLILYEIFILFAAMGGTPFLFAVSGKLIEVFEKTPVISSIPQSGSPLGNLGGLGFTGPVISSSEFFYFTLVTIFITSLFSSFIVGVIRKGTKNEGIKYFPFVLALSYMIFFAVNWLLNVFFTTIL